MPAGELAIGSDTTGVVRIAGGGQAANTAAWLARAGSPVTLIAAVGADEAGRLRTAELTALGVRCAVRRHDGAATGSVIVLASGGERTMVTDRGAALLLDAADVAAAIAATDRPGHLHLSGYPLLDLPSRPAGLLALARARELGITTSVDASSAAPLQRVGAAAFLEWVRGVDLLLANTDEATVLVGAGTAAEQAAALTRWVQHAVVKRGDAGATWCAADGTTHEVPAHTARAVDATGAGDAFAAGLLQAWCAGAEPRAALTAATVWGADAVGRLGARPAHASGPACGPGFEPSPDPAAARTRGEGPGPS